MGRDMPIIGAWYSTKDGKKLYLTGIKERDDVVLELTFLDGFGHQEIHTYDLSNRFSKMYKRGS